MRATSALPTEDRVKKMNDVQWIWYYLNIVKDEEEVDIEDKNKLDYLTFFINPQLAEGVMKNKGKEVKGKSEVNHTNTLHNTFFDKELKEALAESGISEDTFVELPSSDAAGDPNESEADFIARVMNEQFNSENFNQPQSFENTDDDVDYFDYPEE